MKRAVYMLEHSYEKDGDDQVRLIGIYSLRKYAVEAINNLKDKPEFNLYPKKCFIISKVHINKSDWTEGFTNLKRMEEEGDYKDGMYLDVK